MRIFIFSVAYLAITSVAQVLVTDTTSTPSIVIPSAVQGLFGFPTPDPTLISSGFGPRWKWSDSRYDWHQGIDFYNSTVDTVVSSIGDGVVYAKYVYPDARMPNGGNVLSVVHTLPQPIQFHGFNVTKLYSVYLHLASFASGTDVGATITKGQSIGIMGRSGDTTFVHCHFETRWGRCALSHIKSRTRTQPAPSCSSSLK